MARELDRAEIRIYKRDGSLAEGRIIDGRDATKTT
jgi:hypothetical protein